MSTKYYVYLLIDPRNSQPFYAGKGSGRRMFAHKDETLSPCVQNKPHHDRIQELLDEDMLPQYIQLFSELNETAALNKERDLISQIGRVCKSTGPLLNKTCGGQGGNNTNAKPVAQYNLEGKFIQIFPSAKVASECVSTSNRSYITQCCKRKRKSSGGFQWRYENDIPPSRYNKQYFRKINQHSMNDTFIRQWDSLSEAAQRYDVDVRSISHACSGRVKTCKGFIWKYI